jgi:hypothetical protein
VERWLSKQIAAEGGTAEEIYHAHGNDLDAAREALSLERTRALLLVAESHAEQDCAFFLHPHDDFKGVQGDARRWMLMAETNAYIWLVVDTKTPAIGGGGRLMIGHGIGPRFTLATGPELTAAATLLPSSTGGVNGIATLAVPILLRSYRFSHIFDVELAPVFRFNGAAKAFPPGPRLEISYGSSSLRSTNMMNYFMLYLGYEYHFASNGYPADNTIQGGTRIAFDLGL